MEQVKDQHLAEGRYAFTELVNLDRLRSLLEKFSEATGFTAGVVSYPGQEVLIATGWRDVCSLFHRAHASSEAHCKASNRELTEGLVKRKAVNISRCRNGLVDAATPIIIRDVHVANLFTGQALLSKPDLGRFREQAAMHGYDVEAYLGAVAKVPVVTEETLAKHMSFLSELASML
ncbi:MAG: PocR ligand-binding domain-containing protein, partial [Deltaproteobacteria bacterium]|nr:PocR ligand-binding domain-containing protein [Deltaproteobacteria bacterium]